MANQYPTYHLDSLQQQLGKTAWRDVLPAFAHVRMATYGQLDEYLDDLSEGAIRRALNAMVKAQDTVTRPRERGGPDCFQPAHACRPVFVRLAPATATAASTALAAFTAP